MRVAPKVWIGLAVTVGYIALVVALQAISGIPYTDIGDNAHNLFFGVDISLIVGAVVVAAVTTWFGWWGPVLHDRHRSAHRWPIIAPVLMAIIALVGLFSADWGAISGPFIAAALVLLLVGFTEEVVTRGILLRGLRTRFAEPWVWFISTLVFALMHMANSFNGQGIGESTVQAGFAFLAGTIFYILRRTTGSLIPAMILHAAWDFTQFVDGIGTAGVARNLAQGFYPFVGIFGLICVIFVVRRADERITTAPLSGAPHSA